MIFDVINPSDPITLEHEDPLIAAMAVLWIGRGRMGLVDEQGESVLPVFLFGGAEAWLEEHGIEDVGTYLRANRGELAAALESAVLCSPRDRAAVLAALGPEAMPAALARWNEAKRSSLNDICGAMHEMAASIRPHPGEAGTCRVCSCTSGLACDGGCEWSDETEQLCTRCAGGAR